MKEFKTGNTGMRFIDNLKKIKELPRFSFQVNGVAPKAPVNMIKLCNQVIKIVNLRTSFFKSILLSIRTSKRVLTVSSSAPDGNPDIPETETFPRFYLQI